LQHLPDNPLQHWRKWGAPFLNEPKMVNKLSFGRTNQSFLIEVDGQLSVLRINARNSAELGIDRYRELKIFEHASAVGIAPKLHFGSVEHGVLITDFIEGQHWQPNMLANPDNLSLVMDSLNQIHSLDISTAPFDYKQHVENYWQQLLKNNIYITDKLYLKREKLLPRLVSISYANVICHNDPNPMNIIIKSDKVYFLDWEYAALAWQAFDFAAFSIEWKISTTKLPVPANISTEEIDLAIDLYIFLCELWTCLQNNPNLSKSNE
jgi:thiamine kinase-like enzyme